MHNIVTDVYKRQAIHLAFSILTFVFFRKSPLLVSVTSIHFTSMAWSIIFQATFKLHGIGSINNTSVLEFCV